MLSDIYNVPNMKAVSDTWAEKSILYLYFLISDVVLTIKIPLKIMYTFVSRRLKKMHKTSLLNLGSGYRKKCRQSHGMLVNTAAAYTMGLLCKKHQALKRRLIYSFLSFDSLSNRYLPWKRCAH